MARRRTESFENGTNLIFINTTGGVVGVSTLAARNGLYGYLHNNLMAVGGSVYPLLASYVDGCHHFHLRCSTYAGTAGLFDWRASTTVLGSLRLTASNQLSIWVGTPPTQIKVATGTKVLTDGSWYNIQLYTNIHGSTGDILLWIDSALDIDYSNQNTQPGIDTTFNQVCFGNAGVEVIGGGNASYDDYIFQDTTGVSENGQQVGIKNISRAAPTGDSATNNAWPRSTGTDGWPLVNEAPPDDTDYVYSTTNGQKQGHTFDTAGLPSGAAVTSVLFSYVGRKITAGQFKIGCRSNTTDSVGSAIDPGIDNSVHQTRFLLNPDGSVAWTIATADAAESLIESVI